MTEEERLLRLAEVEDICGIRRALIYRLMGEGTFPRPIRISKKGVRWPLSKVRKWVAKQIADADAA